MYKCFYCGNPVAREVAVIDHLLPRSNPDYNHEDNIVLAHQLCVPVQLSLWERFQNWLDKWKPCPKELGGYNCRHRVMSNGKMECGEEENYWKGDRE